MSTHPKNNCLLINIYFPSTPALNAELDELCGLVSSINWQVKATLSFRRNFPNAKYFCGQGKLEEIQNIISSQSIDAVVFNHAITPSQERNLSQILACPVIDRTRLILEIFSQRAHTHEGKLQVELANLNYAATRLIKGWSHLERQKGGIGVRGGPGETQLELDRRMLRQRITQIEKRLQKVKQQRRLSLRARRNDNVPTVAIVGYTNAGKSTLFNCVTAAKVLAKDQLFATLDPTLRQVFIPKLGKAVLADTVGFIRHLPHDLVDAFCATLEEVVEADLLIHVIDRSDEDYLLYISQVNAVLKQINADNKPIILAYNKIDQIAGFQANILYHQSQPATVYLSAKTGDGVNYLYQAIAQYFNHEWLKGVLHLSAKQGKVRAALYGLGAVEKEKIAEDGSYQLALHIAKNNFNQISNMNKLELMANFSHHDRL